MLERETDMPPKVRKAIAKELKAMERKGYVV